ncbi:Uncharacterised protein [Mycolicibacterium fortuitum]|uniref:Uncharacterized protein n=1 Tax=Mycolicibacterium fortuitum TaxID=1766 RepID=A0A378WEI1_MYCFO|nr:Uncharacterised protein [Mycolicibacterium fortuitum]
MNDIGVVGNESVPVFGQCLLLLGVQCQALLPLLLGVAAACVLGPLGGMAARVAVKERYPLQGLLFAFLDQRVDVGRCGLGQNRPRRNLELLVMKSEQRVLDRHDGADLVLARRGRGRTALQRIQAGPTLPGGAASASC